MTIRDEEKKRRREKERTLEPNILANAIQIHYPRSREARYNLEMNLESGTYAY